MKDPDEVNLDEPITWVAPTLTFICPCLKCCDALLDMYVNLSHILYIYIYYVYIVYIYNIYNIYI